MDNFSAFAVGAMTGLGLSAPNSLSTPTMPLGAATNRLMGPPPGMEMMQAMMMQQQQMIMQLLGLLLQLMGGSQGAAGTLGSAPGSLSGGSSQGAPAGGSGGGAFNTPGGVAADPSQFQGGTEMSRKLAAAALRESTDGDSSGGWCSRDVGEALRAVGLGVARGDAWTKAAVLAGDPRFKELKVAPNEIDRLPPGAIIVWDKGPGLPYGHISIALGDGREASDLLKKQMHLKTSYRVFLPI